ncbi:MAG: hypothetical protein IPK15_13370 [Verrucomicrobia bacterium]|nr:hypothetical protein [Verrucomicrobiota bacterium]
MKPLANLLLLLAVLPVPAAEAVRQILLNPAQMVRLPVARDQLTTVRFPSPISDLEGAFFSPEPGPPALFQISFRPGNAFFALRALATNASATLSVGWRGQTYVLQCIESTDPLLSVTFVDRPTLASRSGPARRRPTPARLSALLEMAELYEPIRLQHPDRVAQVQRGTPRRRVIHAGCEVVLEEVFRFESDDALVFHATIHNPTIAPVIYKPETLAVTVGDRTFSQAAAHGSGIVGPCSQSSVFLIIAAGTRGTPPGISVQNDFRIVFERVGPRLIAPRCPSDRPEARPPRPARSPKHESTTP